MSDRLGSQHAIYPGWVGIFVVVGLLLPLVGLGYIFYLVRCLDGCGPYHNASSVADLDGDGDLDIVLSNLRHESETIIWAGPTLWINQGGGKFAPRRVNFGGPFATAGDVDRDGDADLLELVTDALQIHLNYGDQDRVRGNFQVWFVINAGDKVDHPASHGSVQLGDLNNDGWLDAFVGGCCGVLEKENGKSIYYPSRSWVWLNPRGDFQHSTGLSLGALGDLPMRPALGDLDGDGDLDVYAAIQPAKRGGSYISADRVLLNDGRGNFRDSGQRLGEFLQSGADSGGFFTDFRRLVSRGISNLAGHAGSTAVALGDLDGDGDLDALVGKKAGAQVWTNQGGEQGGQQGVFAAATQHIPGEPVETVFLADLDGDADLDALLAGEAQAALWWNNGQASFRDSGQRFRYSERHGLAIGDFNGDSYLDLCAPAYDTDYHVWLNQGDGSLLESQ